MNWTFKKVPMVVLAIVFFPISIPLLIANNAKRRKRNAFVRAFDILQTQGVTPALEYLGRYPKQTPSGVEELFKAFEVETDEAWLEHTNTWLATVSEARLTLAPGDAPRFHRMAFSEAVPVKRPEKITVIMPAYNAGPLIRSAVQSILEQSWQNLELIVVNDKSTDETGAILDALAQTDARMQVLHNSVNVGPYVSKNIALERATGDLITGHDADDIALPDRLERQAEIILGPGEVDAVIGHMVRLDDDGLLSYASGVHKNSFNGLHRMAMISLMIRRETLKQFGYWDSVRFGADSELVGRLRAVLGSRLQISQMTTMLCLDAVGSLTNHPEHGLKTAGSVSPVRQTYKTSWENWHEAASGRVLHRAFSNAARPFDAPKEMLTPQADIETLQRQHLGALPDGT